MAKLSRAQERQFKRQRREGRDMSRLELMKSTTLTEREKRCLQWARTRREAKVKKFQNRHAYLKRRKEELEEQVQKDGGHIRRLRSCVMRRVEELLFDDDNCNSGSSGDGATADGLATIQAEDTGVSAAQMSQLFAQAMAVMDVLEEVLVRDVLIQDQITTALGALLQGSDAGVNVAKTSLTEASLLRPNNLFLLITGRVSEKMDEKYDA